MVDAKAPPFIRALVTVVCEGAMERGNFIDKRSFLCTLFRYVSAFVTLRPISAFFLNTGSIFSDSGSFSVENLPFL